MIQINSTFQQREYSQDEFGSGTFAWVPVTKEKIELLLRRVLHSDLQINLIVTSRHEKKITGMGKSKFIWSKSKGGTRNIFFDPVGREDAVIAVIDSIMEISSSLTGAVAQEFLVESSLDIGAKTQTEINKLSNLSNITIICN